MRGAAPAGSAWIATRHGLIRDASGIALILSQIYVKLGEIDRALQIGREGLAISERVRGPIGHAWHCLSFAGVDDYAPSF